MVRSHLNENGVMIVNMNMTSQDADGINAYLQDTIASVFDYVYTADVARATNRELFASQNPDMLHLLEERTAARDNSADIRTAQLCTMMHTVLSGLQKYEGGNRILTDDKAPVELLGMRAIDDMISVQLTYYKKRFEEDGIRGIIGN